MSGETRWSDRVCSGDATWSGNVYDFFFRIHDRMTADVRTPFTMSDSVSCVDDTEVHKALREALANALVHADYFGRQGVVVEKTVEKNSATAEKTTEKSRATTEKTTRKAGRLRRKAEPMR